VDRQDLDELFSIAYEELKRLAATVRRTHPNATLNPTALVHEAWIRLAGSAPLEIESPLHFKRVAARAMRHVLVDAARRRNAQKRGADVDFVRFDDTLHGGPSSAEDVLALDDALERLSTFSPRQASMVELRFFGGFEAAETAELLSVSEATVQRDWRAARAWLAADLHRGC